MKYNLSDLYTREEFLNEFSSSDIETLGLQFPKESEMREDLERYLDDDSDLCEVKDEFYYQVFIPHLELKLWDCSESEKEKNTLEFILSHWENVVDFS